jgi:predicted TIM-barrel fold metal-dependent hydrolase
MASTIVDVHPHTISPDVERYPPSPLFGVRSDWSKNRTARIEDLLAEMDRAGVQKAAIVHASTVYGFDNSLVVDAARHAPDRCVAVGSIDLLAPDAIACAKNWIERGVVCFRIFTGGSTKAVDASSLDDPRTYPVWDLMGERGLSMCINTNVSGVPAIVALARRFPNVPILVDHFAQADVTGGGDFAAAAPLFGMAALANIHLKLTPAVPSSLRKAEADGRAFMKKVVAEFGAGRIAWGSDWPSSPGTMAENLAVTRDLIADLSEVDRDLILGGTALTIYSMLKGV